MSRIPNTADDDLGGTGGVSRPKTDLELRMTDEYLALVECLDRIRIWSFGFRTSIWYRYWSGVRMCNLGLPVRVLDPETDLPFLYVFFAGVR